MKLVKITALILIFVIPLTLADRAHAGLWTDFKEGFKKFYGKFKKETGTSGKAIKEDFKKAGSDISQDTRKAGAAIKQSSKEIGQTISDDAKSATKELKNTFNQFKKKLD